MDKLGKHKQPLAVYDPQTLRNTIVHLRRTLVRASAKEVFGGRGGNRTLNP